MTSLDAGERNPPTWTRIVVSCLPLVLATGVFIVGVPMFEVKARDFGVALPWVSREVIMARRGLLSLSAPYDGGEWRRILRIVIKLFVLTVVPCCAWLGVRSPRALLTVVLWVGIGLLVLLAAAIGLPMKAMYDALHQGGL